MINTLKRDYDIKVDWKGGLFVGIKLEWDYEKRTLDTHVPEFFSKALHKYQNKKPAKPQHAPAKAAPIQYGAKVQTTNADTPPLHISRQNPMNTRRRRHFFLVLQSNGSNNVSNHNLHCVMAIKTTENLEEEVKQFLD